MNLNSLNERQRDYLLTYLSASSELRRRGYSVEAAAPLAAEG